MSLQSNKSMKSTESKDVVKLERAKRAKLKTDFLFEVLHGIWTAVSCDFGVMKTKVYEISPAVKKSLMVS